MTQAQPQPSGPSLAITMGDPAGIGPELCVKLFAGGLIEGGRAFVIGDPDLLASTAAAIAPDVRIRRIAGPDDAIAPQAAAAARVLPVLAAGAPLGHVVAGRVEARNGQAAFDYVHTAIGLARAGHVGGIVTAPLHKEALAAAGIPFPGHTEILATYGGSGSAAMMLANDHLRVVLVTIHCPLADAIARITIETETKAIRLAHDGARRFGIASPRIAVAGLNPHAGEGGLFGREEIDIIRPAVEAMRATGLDVTGPWPGDTVFLHAREGRFDVVVAQYHDQGLIPIKYLGLSDGVNITLGLPFVRTSPDHGTAYDIAGMGRADPASLATAYRCALRLIETQPLSGDR